MYALKKIKKKHCVGHLILASFTVHREWVNLAIIGDWHLVL